MCTCFTDNCGRLEPISRGHSGSLWANLLACRLASASFTFSRIPKTVSEFAFDMCETRPLYVPLSLSQSMRLPDLDMFLAVGNVEMIGQGFCAIFYSRFTEEGNLCRKLGPEWTFISFA